MIGMIWTIRMICIGPSRVGEIYMERISVKQTLDFHPRTKIRLSEIERLIKKHRIIIPPPSRQTLIKLCEDGTFETVGGGPTAIGWLVFEDSFTQWVRSLDEGTADTKNG